MKPGLHQQEHGQSSSRNYCTCWTTVAILCLALMQQLRETLTSWRWSKGGSPTWQSAAEPALVEGIGFVQPTENPTQTFQDLKGAQRGDGSRNSTGWSKEIPLENKKQKVWIIESWNIGVGRDLVSFQTLCYRQGHLPKARIKHWTAHPENAQTTLTGDIPNWDSGGPR